MKISFVVLNYKSVEDTISLISQIRQCHSVKNTKVEVVIVDNDYTPKLESQYQNSSDVVYLKSPGNLGFAAGNNLGFNQALEGQADIIVTINNDTEVPKDLIEKITKSKINDKTVGAVGGLIYFAKGFEYEKGYQKKDLGRVVWYGGGKIDWKNVYVGHLHVNEVDSGQFKTEETPFITGCLLIVRSEVLKRVGFFDERYCMYLEDADLCERIKRSGLKLVFDPSIKLWHKVAQGSGIGSSLNDYFLTRNRMIFGFTYTNLRTKFALFRESLRKMIVGTSAQKLAYKDFYFKNYGWGSWKH